MHLTRKSIGLVAPAVALAAAALVAGSGTAAQASTSAAHVKPFVGVFNEIKNVGNNLCMQATQATSNVPVVQEPCDSTNPLQGWQFTQVSGSTYGFLNQASGACLFAFIGAQNGAPMGVDTCRKVSNEQFDTHTTLPDVTVLESKIGFSDTGFCVDVPGATSTPGVQLQLFTCNGTLAQRWVVGFAS
jgi:hypothetical protein